MEFLTDPAAWWIEPFTTNVFMQRALYAALLVVLTTSVVGTWVVLRGMSFLGDALAHGVLPGIALAFIIGVDTTIGAFVAAMAMVWGINLIRSHSPLPEDTSIGVLFVGFLSLAVAIMSSASGAYSGDLNRFLFGSITGVNAADLRQQAVAAVISVGGVVVFYRAFLVMTFDQAQAAVLGLRPRFAHGVLLALLALSIIASFEVVGNLLVFAFLIAPPATAVLLVRRVPRIMVAAAGLGAASSVIGLLISYHHDTAAGATMALATVVVFVAVLTVKSAWQALISHNSKTLQVAQA
ncbi:MAG: metal ABC transporter permease [Acidimicrobiaceae bacterium]|nr:metal ABC transporter permease [Acidimicrobiaceae bacterium]MCY4280904.1 metal ABC transporter permease [Acidimicrobiaceae bacterium]MCY4294274.1 metal ABC transporter permease [Acidimicrobiaceae bacterium]